ncbi:NUDIX hydrolase [Maridesulfovibrio salexigens]|uniref:NUDIX hydrolase n=1 Tax=Maridesulfovibrio salexigens (strain ATCC 14822 / DSM 2638 / NCIMB 8403 / VKM B-1763) TaxID=526222 RepID=C6BUI5_MARSD|nr:NUDIX domain-containing protein [Maridesulfovibrio salexigens]ACS79994.1 NUDIX hydrolase [Maridesulfovibrio salexigens DSM 2638]
MKKNPVQIEVVDQNNRPLTSMDINEVHRQSLRHRSVIILVYDNEGKLFLQKRSPQQKLYAGRWDVSVSGHVYTGESNEKAALRELENTLRIRSSSLKLIEDIEASSETGYEFISLFVLDKLNTAPELMTEDADSGYFYSESELDWLIREYRELLVPSLVFLNDRNLLFKFK